MKPKHPLTLIKKSFLQKSTLSFSVVVCKKGFVSICGLFLEDWISQFDQCRPSIMCLVCCVHIEYCSTHALVRAHGAEEPDADDDAWISGSQQYHEVLHQTICQQNRCQGGYTFQTVSLCIFF